jgi:hypothetical protein
MFAKLEVSMRALRRPIMSTPDTRLASIAAATTNLKSLLSELEGLRELVRKATPENGASYQAARFSTKARIQGANAGHR